jgi:hypothetical protein
MNAGLPAVGYQVLSVECPRCNHKGMIAPERAKLGKKFRCNRCGCHETVRWKFSTQLVWVGGPKPDNVTLFRKRRP